MQSVLRETEIEKTAPQEKAVVSIVSVHLTAPQKAELEEMIRDWGIDTAQVGRRLIRYLLNSKVTLLTLLQKYQAQTFRRKAAREPRIYRICIRLPNEEKQKLNVLANDWFYLPGELARILFELFITKVIKKSDIWE